ncbi:1-aminocyclopropane-1-carboxylate synthase [Canna indica]|uniref:1-aminocyclopropane-1-carboxylate synthase n=1 Tax=Canna indica TaxID=4628 RepID=A0AAQ3QCE1_9LILI|nr:1-aminocyclopropane-1-carboxylate synthase [Canna indica]
MGIHHVDEINSSCLLLSRVATNDGHGENSSYFDGWKAYDSNPFHPTRNPEGVIQMGLAEHQLCLGTMQEWIRKNPKASICTEEGLSQFKDIANFQDYHGLPQFRKAIAKFMGKVRGGRAEFDADRVVMSGGATGAQETLAFCLANPGEAFLIPTPYYPAFDRDFRWRTGVQLLPIHCHSINNFKITETALMTAYRRALKSNIKVKGILVTNPSNPLGTTMDRATLRTLARFANENNIHLICDEIFGGTVFDGPEFASISTVLEDDPRLNRDLFHIAYSLSKDLGVPGFRVGIIYSYNDAVVSCARKMSSFGLVSTQTQHLLAAMLGDDEFTTKLLAESRRQLSRRHAVFTSGLERVGIRCLESNAGLFFWMNLKHLLKAATVEAELELWRVIIHKVKLNISPGSAFHCSEPGWFRVCFANMDDGTMEVALRRIRAFVYEANERGTTSAQTTKNKKRFDRTLRLSLPRRFDHDLMTTMTPRLMSPHSPLVKAAN